MSTTDNRKSHFRIQTDAYAKYIEDTISFNVKVMLAINGMNQTDLANGLGVEAFDDFRQTQWKNQPVRGGSGQGSSSAAHHAPSPAG